MALEDEDWEVRKVAVERLTNQEVLSKVALEDESWVVRKAAVDKLTNQNLLKIINKIDETDLYLKYLCEDLLK